MRTLSALLCCLPLLAACEQLGIDDPAKIAAARNAEGKAIGGACRYSGRTIEECYSLNPRALKAAVFAGWLEMDGYMRDNKLHSPPPRGTAWGAADPVAPPEAAKPPASAAAKNGKGAPPAKKPGKS